MVDNKKKTKKTLQQIIKEADDALYNVSVQIGRCSEQFEKFVVAWTRQKNEETRESDR